MLSITANPSDFDFLSSTNNQSGSGLNTLTALARKANELARRLQTQRDYKVTEADYWLVLLPLNQIWTEQSSVSLEDLLEAGLSYDAAAFLIGWLTSQH